LIARAAATTALVLASLPSPSARALAPFQEWRTLESSCCDIHYPRRLEQAARRVAPLADEIDTTVVGFLGRAPEGRVQIVLEDETDHANGWALSVPYNTVHLFVIAPNNYSELGDTDDWLRSLLLHEYTHIVHMDTVGGLPRAVQRVTGKLWAPNQVQPPWFVEGIAIYAETRFSSGGRVRASMHDMYLRTAALAGRVLTLDELSSGTRRWPRGTPWLYGGRFLSYIVERYGEEALRTISARYGAQLIPYGLNRAASEVLDQSYDVLYADFVEALTERARQVRDRVEALGPDRSQRLTRFGEMVREPVVTADGGLIFYADPRDEAPGLYRYDLTNGATTRLMELNGFDGMALLPDGRLLLSQPEIFDNFFAYYDLYRVDLQEGTSERLTRGLRAREPAVAPDGRSALFVRREGDACALSRIDLETGAVADLRRFDDGSQFYTPSYAPDGNSAVVGLWRPGGQRDLWRVDLETAALEQLTSDRAIDLDPTYTTDGGRVLFSSDREGVFHIYALDLADRAVRQVSNAVSGAFAPAVDASGAVLFFLGYTADGFDLFALDADATLGLPASPSYQRPLPAPPPTALSAEARRYNPLPTLRPYSWIPLVASDFAGPTLGASVEGSDAVGAHQYALQASWGTLSGALNVHGGYGFNDLPTPLRLTFSRYEFNRPVLLNPTAELAEQRETGWRGEVLLILPLLRWTRTHSFGVGYGVEASDAAFPALAPDEGYPRLPWRGRTNAARLFWGYRDTRRFVDSVSTERGLSTSLSLRAAHPALGSESSFFEAFASGAGYLQVPGLRGHVVAALLQGSVAIGPREQRRLYAVGGLPERNLVEDLLLQVRLGGGYLRGYPSGAFAGDGYLLGSLEYRLPLLSIERGLSTLPIFLDRTSATFFGDMGGAFLEVPRAQDLLHRAVGVELRAELVLGYQLPLALRIGVARGFDERGLDAQPYLVLGTSY